LIKALFALVVAALLAAAGYAVWYVATPVAVAKLPAEFELPAGTRFRGAAQRIDAAGIGIGRIQFELLARALGRDQDIKAGSYELASAPTPLELLDKLTRGDVTQAELRFIEGWTFRQLRAALDAHPSVRHETQGMADAPLLQKLGAAETHPEGLFFPDTYLFSKGTSDLHILRRSYDAMQRHLAQEWASRDSSAPYRTPYEALTMASIVEKETGREADRALVAAVFINRLRAGMRLESDPTIVYGLTQGRPLGRGIRRSELQRQTPWNTYQIDGLPPTPIANPGKEALEAVLNPPADPALFFVADGSGGHVFAVTYEEHLRNVARWRQIERQKAGLPPETPAPVAPEASPAPMTDPNAEGGQATLTLPAGATQGLR